MTAQIGDLYHYGETEYTLIKQYPQKPFDPRQFGLKPDGNCCSACWDGFWCDFSIIDGRLLLKNLYIQTEDGNYPVISGVAVDPQPHRPWDFPVYRNLYIPIGWSGKVLVGEGYLEGFDPFYLFRRFWAYQNLREFVFKAGNLIATNDHSALAAQLRPLVPKRDPYGITWDYKKAAPMQPYSDVWWA